MIPKVIHYCWFGGNELPDLAKKCIESWKKNCPDYEIRRWDESNFDLNICDYVREAYEVKKWAFVSDFARFWILYNNGGVYFDTDVEILKSIDPLIEKGPFWGRERREGETDVLVNAGLGMASEARNPLYEEVIRYYETLHFINEDGSYNKTTVVEHVSKLMYAHGLPQTCERDDSIYEVENIIIYPWEFFCPLSYKTGNVTITENTYTIHHFTASWKSKEEIIIKLMESYLTERMGRKIGGGLARILGIPVRLEAKIRECGVKKTMGIILRRNK